MSVFKWEDATGTYKGTADGYFYFRIKQDGTKTTDLTVKVYGVTAGQGTVTNYEISGTYGSWTTTSVKSEKENKTWAGMVNIQNLLIIILCGPLQEVVVLVELTLGIAVIPVTL